MTSSSISSVADLRQRAQMSHWEVAQLVGVTAPEIRRLEKGELADDLALPLAEKVTIAVNEALTIRIRRWRIFLGLDGALLAIQIGLWCFCRTLGEWVIWPAAVLGPWLFFTLPICIWYLLGKAPPALNLSPLWPTAEERAYRKTLQARQCLSDDEFVQKFYGDSEVPPQIPIALRNILKQHVDVLLEKVEPDDYLLAISSEVDWAVLFRPVKLDLGVDLRSNRDLLAWDGTFDSMIRIIQQGY